MSKQNNKDMEKNKQYILQRTDNKGNLIINKRSGYPIIQYYTSSGGDRMVSVKFIHLADRFDFVGDAMRKAIELHKAYNKYFKIVPTDSLNIN